MSVVQAKPEHEVAYQEICELVNRNSANLTALELLAIASNMIGKMIAMQDHRIVSPEEAMQVVAMNIEQGNKQVVDQLNGSAGNS